MDGGNRGKHYGIQSFCFVKIRDCSYNEIFFIQLKFLSCFISRDQFYLFRVDSIVNSNNFFSGSDFEFQRFLSAIFGHANNLVLKTRRETAYKRYYFELQKRSWVVERPAMRGKNNFWYAG